MKSRLHALIHLLCSAKIIFWLTPLLMVLLVIGTVAQKYIGLYEAQRIFFFNPIIWWGVIPLPGTTLLLGVILVGLCTKFIFKSQWTWKRSGVNLSHLGVLILLLGGLITMLYKEEGAITLFDNDTSNQVVDYYERELVITKNDRVIGCYDFDHLTVNRVITFKDYPMQVTILDACQNCAIEKRSSDQINESLRSMARKCASLTRRSEGWATVES